MVYRTGHRNFQLSHQKNEEQKEEQKEEQNKLVENTHALHVYDY